MISKSIFIAPIISCCLLVMNFNNVVYSQMTLRIEFSGNEKQVKETKKLLSEHNIYFILTDDEEINVTYTKDSLLIMENITDEQIKQIKSQRFPLVKFRNKKYCFYTMVSVNFFKSNIIKNLLIYRIPKEKSIMGLITITKKSTKLASELSYTERGLSINHPITMIPCSKYKGEYDNGLESYRKSRRDCFPKESE